jgi:two-component system response regulator
MARKKPILLVEDSESEGPTVRQALGELGVGDRVVRSSTAAEALEYLRSDTAAKPAVVLVDVSTRDADGLGLLRRVKAEERLKTIPVIVIAPSSDVQIINESFGLGAAGYVVKSPDLDEFVEAVRAIHQYWMLSELPVG